MRLAINGFGRIGRHVFKIAFDRPGIEVVAINDITDAKTNAHLLKYDSVYGKYHHEVKAEGDAIFVNGKKVAVSAEQGSRAAALEGAGRGRGDRVHRRLHAAASSARWHLEAGARKVILTVPAKDKIDATIVLGVNDETLKPEDKIISNASCTTNCLAPIAKVLNDTFGIIDGLMTTVHAYTNDQRSWTRPTRTCAGPARRP